MKPVTFEVYSLEEICNDLNVDLGSQYLDYLVDDILSCELDCSTQGMEYSLVYMQTIIDTMDRRMSAYDEDPDQFEIDLINHFKNFMQGKDEQTLVFIQGF